MPSTRHRTDPIDIAKQIRLLRGRLVLLDVDLADLYGVAPERLADAVRRNPSQFPVELAFSVEPDEIRDLNSRIATLAFTEHGVIIAASVLNSSRAVEMSIHIVRTFVKLREETPGEPELVRRIEALTKSVATFDAKTREQFEEVCRAIRELSVPPQLH